MRDIHGYVPGGERQTGAAKAGIQLIMIQPECVVGKAGAGDGGVVIQKKDFRIQIPGDQGRGFLSGGSENIGIPDTGCKGGIVVGRGSLQGNKALLFPEQAAIFRGQEEGGYFSGIIGNAALKDGIFHMQGNDGLRREGHFLHHPADSGVQVPGPKGGGCTVVEGGAVFTENGMAGHILRGSDVPDLLQTFIQHDSLTGLEIKVRKSGFVDSQTSVAGGEKMGQGNGIPDVKSVTGNSGEGGDGTAGEQQVVRTHWKDTAGICFGKGIGLNGTFGGAFDGAVWNVETDWLRRGQFFRWGGLSGRIAGRAGG